MIFKLKVLFILCAVMMSSIISTTAFAATSTTIYANISNTDTFVGKQIDKAVSSADQAGTLFVNMQDTDLCSTLYQMRIDRISANLISVTNVRAGNTIDMASRNDISVISEYIPVTLGNSTYLVDPLRCH